MKKYHTFDTMTDISNWKIKLINDDEIVNCKSCGFFILRRGYMNTNMNINFIYCRDCYECLVMNN